MYAIFNQPYGEHLASHQNGSHSMIPVKKTACSSLIVFVRVMLFFWREGSFLAPFCQGIGQDKIWDDRKKVHIIYNICMIYLYIFIYIYIYLYIFIYIYIYMDMVYSTCIRFSKNILLGFIVTWCDIFLNWIFLPSAMITVEPPLKFRSPKKIPTGFGWKPTWCILVHYTPWN